MWMIVGYKIFVVQDMSAKHPEGEYQGPEPQMGLSIGVLWKVDFPLCKRNQAVGFGCNYNYPLN